MSHISVRLMYLEMSLGITTPLLCHPEDTVTDEKKKMKVFQALHHLCTSNQPITINLVILMFLGKGVNRM